MKTNPGITTVILLASLLSACQPTFNQQALPPSISPENKAEIDRAVTEAIRDNSIASLSVAIRVSDEPILAQAYGSADIEANKGADQKTIYSIGSITKTFTAVSIMRLVDDGRVALEEPVTTYIEELPAEAESILVSHLMSHTSGLPNLEETNIPIDYSHAYAPNEIVGMLSDDFPALHFDPGTGFHYSNLGYFLLGVIIEEVTGESYYTYLKHNIIEPAGLESTGSCASSGGSLAQGYKVSRQELIPADPSNLTLAYSAGGLCSNAEDLIQWYSALSSGNLIGKQDFSRLTSPVLLPDGTSLDSGMGFIVGDFLGEKAVGHIGRISGYESFLVHFADVDLTIVVLSNTIPAEPYGITNLIGSLRDILAITR